MLSFFPTIYEDELLYSAISRYHIRSGNIAILHTYKDLFSSSYSINSSIYFPSRIGNFIKNMPIDCQYTEEYIINNHTLYPFFTSFVNENLSNKVFNMMKGNNASGIYALLGIGMTMTNKSKYLKFCPECMKEDTKKYGETYWHRLHQAPGVLVCNKHKVLLKNSTIPTLPDKPLFAIPSEQNCLSDDKNIYSKDIIEKLYLLAKDIEKVLNLSTKRRDSIWYRENYINNLMKIGLVTLKRQIKKKELIETFKMCYGEDFLELLESNIDDKDSYNWLFKITKSSQPINPIKHLLLIRFLDIKLEDIFEYQYEYKPFGASPWPCLNKACRYYKKDIIDDVSTTYNYRPTKTLVGTFSCSCGFTYTRQAMDIDNNSRYKFKSVKSFGGAWESKLIDLVERKNLSINQIAEELNVTRKTIDRYAEKLNLEIYWRTKDGHRYDKNIIKNKKDICTKQNYRNKWLDLLEENPNKSRNDLILSSNSTYRWLYKYDRKWLYNHLPDSKRRTKKINNLADWNSKDGEMLIQVKEVVKKIIGSDEKPEKISVSSIANKTEEKWLIKKHLYVIPKTEAYINSVKESTRSFRIRKLKWAIKEISNSEEQVTLTKVVRKISLDTKGVNELRDIINKEIEEINNIKCY